LPVAAARLSQQAMSDRSDPKRAELERNQRLAAALRDNLRRRKAQAREEAAGGATKSATD